ncbi:MAG: DUF389 domain-containing protein, partial [Flavobacteriales bacterium]|nr:DUF389 domain-containing protein [Flavobacteriales bacterium]
MAEENDSDQQDEKDQIAQAHGDAEAKRTLRASIKGLYEGVRDFLGHTMNIADDTNIEGTVTAIKRDMVFRGQNVWILICSIVVASVGLNVNSTAVIIGAMLISPLMGPILALGLAIGTNDWELLKRAWKNFGVMVVVSLITSTIYFFISPLSDAQSELLARTRPTFLDAMIASFGGLAGIIGLSRRNNYSTVLPGVAIATALMPPLCTAGYGIATLQFEYFLGAFYLFLINSIFISGATLVVVKYLKFPLVSFINTKTERRVRLYMALSVIVVLLPSGWIFYDVVRETVFIRNANRFVAENIVFEGTEILTKKLTYNDSVPRIDLYMMGEPISEEAQMQLKRTMLKYGL